MTPTLRAPFPYFGGKSRAKHLVWAAFGDVPNYVEPFFGSGAVLLGRPGTPGTETVNDIDGYVSNFWRAVQADPEAVAYYADWPVNEVDLHARHRWLVGATPASAEHIKAWRRKMKLDPLYYDAWIAGWWVWGLCQWIGSGWCAAPEWWERAKEGDRLGDGRRPSIKSQGVQSKALFEWEGRTNAGRDLRGIHGRGVAATRGRDTSNVNCRPATNRGVNTAEHEQRPDLTASRGVLSVDNEKRPHLWRGGVGTHSRRAVPEKLPLLGGRGGKGVLGGDKRVRDLDGSAEWEKRPSLKRGGRGVSRHLPEQLPSISGDGSGSGRGVLSDKMFKADRGTASRLRSDGIFEWMENLCVRLRRVRICCGDWSRIVGPAVTTCIGLTGVFLDPPYGSEHRDPRIYSHDSMDVAGAVRSWALEHGDDRQLKIALCGYEGEHDMPPTWQCVPWKASGGYAASAGNHDNAHRERIWFSPACNPVHDQQMSFFGKEATAT